VVHGDGSQTRDYIYLDDAVDAMVAAASARNVDKQVINVGSGRETSVRELAQLVGAATGHRVEVLYSSADNGGVSRMCADIRLAGDRLGFRPRVSLAEGLALCLQRDPRFQAKPA
jgi:UDP-glucose 4-epimerase